MSAIQKGPPETTDRQPAWDIARLFPDQGFWSEDDYLELNARRVEFTDGFVEVLPVPTSSHQRILFLLCRMLYEFADPRGLGEVLPSGVKVRLRSGKYREPDVVFMLARNADRVTDPFWNGADLVIEVVSPDGKDRDFVKKREDYAEAGIPEYWIIDPPSERIVVLTLPAKEGKYVEHGTFAPGQQATSKLLAGFEVDVKQVFAAMRGVK
jgi:Uma2 family endonuclease